MSPNTAPRRFRVLRDRQRSCRRSSAVSRPTSPPCGTGPQALLAKGGRAGADQHQPLPTMATSGPSLAIPHAQENGSTWFVPLDLRQHLDPAPPRSRRSGHVRAVQRENQGPSRDVQRGQHAGARFGPVGSSRTTRISPRSAARRHPEAAGQAAPNLLRFLLGGCDAGRAGVHLRAKWAAAMAWNGSVKPLARSRVCPMAYLAGGRDHLGLRSGAPRAGRGNEQAACISSTR